MSSESLGSVSRGIDLSRPDDATAPLLGWDEFYDRFDWAQGEHVALVGPTGQGKTTLALSILPKRGHVVMIGTKPKDRTLEGLRKLGWQRIPQWPPAPGRKRVIVWPKWRGEADSPNQARVITETIDQAFRAHNWCIFMDDVQYLTEYLGLGRLIRMVQLQGRSIGVSNMTATQRPVRAPREMFTMSTHLFIWGTRDADDLKSLSGLGGMDSHTVRRWVANLEKHEVLYLHTRDGTLLRTKAPQRPER